MKYVIQDLVDVESEDSLAEDCFLLAENFESSLSDPDSDPDSELSSDEGWSNALLRASADEVPGLHVSFTVGTVAAVAVGVLLLPLLCWSLPIPVSFAGRLIIRPSVIALKLSIDVGSVLADLKSSHLVSACGLMCLFVFF